MAYHGGHLIHSGGVDGWDATFDVRLRMIISEEDPVQTSVDGVVILVRQSGSAAAIAAPSNQERD